MTDRMTTPREQARTVDRIIERRIESNGEMTDTQTAESLAMFFYPTPDIDNAAELRAAFVAGWMARVDTISDVADIREV